MTKPPHVVPFPAGPTPQAWARPHDSHRLTLGCQGPKGPEKPLGKEGLKEWDCGWKASISKAWKKLRGTVFLNEGKGLEGYFLHVLGKEEGEPQHSGVVEGGGLRRGHGALGACSILVGLCPCSHLGCPTDCHSVFPFSPGHTTFSERKSFCGNW